MNVDYCDLILEKIKIAEVEFFERASDGTTELYLGHDLWAIYNLDDFELREIIVYSQVPNMIDVLHLDDGDSGKAVWKKLEEIYNAF